MTRCSTADGAMCVLCNVGAAHPESHINLLDKDIILLKNSTTQRDPLSVLTDRTVYCTCVHPRSIDIQITVYIRTER